MQNRRCTQAPFQMHRLRHCWIAGESTKLGDGLAEGIAGADLGSSGSFHFSGFTSAWLPGKSTPCAAAYRCHTLVVFGVVGCGRGFVSAICGIFLKRLRAGALSSFRKRGEMSPHKRARLRRSDCEVARGGSFRRSSAFFRICAAFAFRRCRKARSAGDGISFFHAATREMLASSGCKR